jgi:hypothetical protein
VGLPLKWPAHAIDVDNRVAIIELKRGGELPGAIDGHVGQPPMRYALKLAPHVL